MVKNDQRAIPLDKLAVAMIAYAWYPVAFCRLSLGKRDSLKTIVESLNENCQIKFHNEEEIQSYIEARMEGSSDVKAQVSQLLEQVPFRILSPWIGTKNSDSASWELIKSYSNGTLYQINKIDNQRILEINPEWFPYLKDNYQILSDFVHWNLVKYVQARNPNVPNIVEKLNKPIQRPSMEKQKKFWRKLFNSGFSGDCIYTGRPLKNGNYDLDHFIPWNYVFHNQLWNLIPANPNVNSSKSDKLPNLQQYLPDFTLFQKRAITHLRNTRIKIDLIEDDYLAIEVNLEDIEKGSEDRVQEIYSNVFSPLVQQAKNLGFEEWNGDVTKFSVQSHP